MVERENVFSPKSFKINKNTLKNKLIKYSVETQSFEEKVEIKSSFREGKRQLSNSGLVLI